jgi:hypothetical protein
MSYQITLVDPKEDGKEALHWARENCPSFLNWHGIESDSFYDKYNYAMHFYFDREDEALMFSLRWK